MVLRMRLQRLGKLRKPFYRVVVANARAPRDGKHLEVIGTYNPLPRSSDGAKELRIKRSRAQYWLGVGAQPTDTVARLLGISGITPTLPNRASKESGVPKAERGED